MNWRFCPNCETQLDDATGICPACRWDPLDVPPPAAAEPEMSLMERYRGTQYDTQLTMAPAMAEQARHGGPTAKARLILLAGVLALVAIYGGIVTWGAMKDGVGSTPVPAQVGASR
ncbi:MAG: hypothetical protein U0869_21145 [Chloroflexota bacterium]